MSEEFKTESPKTNNMLLIGIIVLLVGVGAYFFITKNQVTKEKEDTELRLDEVNIEKETLNQDYNAAIARLDNMTSENASMDSLIKSQGGELDNMRGEIKRILNDKNATQAELKKAKNMITEFENLTSKFQKQIGALKKENIELIENNRNLAEAKQTTEIENQGLKDNKRELEETVEVGSVLSAANISMKVVDKKKNLFGKEKQKETIKARKADLLEVDFSLGVNRIIESGEQTIFVAVKDPSGKVIRSTGNASGSIQMADGASKEYTTKKVVPYTKGKNSYNIKTTCVPTDNFSAGTYTVELYHKGYQIGQDNITLK